jgi:hypothetical protein
VLGSDSTLYCRQAGSTASAAVLAVLRVAELVSPQVLELSLAALQLNMQCGVYY